MDLKGDILSVTLILMISGITVSCSTDSKKYSNVDYAQKAYYFLEFVDSTENQITDSIISAISINMKNVAYILTDNSASLGWPYFATVNVDSLIPIDSLMFPHTTMHIVNPNPDQIEEIEKYTKKIRVTFSNADSLGLYVKYEVFNNSESSWTRIVDSKDHYYNISKYGGIDGLGIELKKTFIRATFK